MTREGDVPPARGERHLPGLQDDRHLRQRIRQPMSPISTPPTRRKTSRSSAGKRRSSCWAPAPSASARAWNSTTPPCTPSGRSVQAGYEAIIINNNPETVSTDYTTSDKLYFEPLTVEDVMNIIDLEKPEGRRGVAGRTDGHQPGRAARRAGRAHHRHGHAGDRERRGPRLLREDHGGAGNSPARGRGRD